KLSPAGLYQPTIRTVPVFTFIFRYAGLMQCGEGNNIPCLSSTFILWPMLILLIGAALLSHRLDYPQTVILFAVFIPITIATLLHALNYGIFAQKHLIATLPLLLIWIAVVGVLYPLWGRILVTLVVIQAFLALPGYYQANPYKPNWR